MVLGVYGLVGIVNLVAALFFKESIRKLSKACLMPALLVFYIVGVGQIQFLVIAALVFSWAGDVLLIQKEKPTFFRLGLAAFLLSHVLYAIAFVALAGSVNVLALVVSAVVAVPLGIAMLRLINPDAAMKIPVTAYAVVIILMSMAALQLMLVRPGFPGVQVYVASLVYIFSDALMAYLLFHRQAKYFNVITMIPYIVAQGGLITGLVLGSWA